MAQAKTKALKVSAKQKLAKPSDPHPSLSPEDQKALARFNSSFSVESIDLNTWQNTHTTLDLIVPVFLKSEEIERGGEKVVHYSYSSDSQAAGPKGRFKSQLRIVWPPKTSPQAELVFEDLGDEKNGQRGRLLIRIMPT